LCGWGLAFSAGGANTASPLAFDMRGKKPQREFQPIIPSLLAEILLRDKNLAAILARGGESQYDS